MNFIFILYDLPLMTHESFLLCTPHKLFYNPCKLYLESFIHRPYTHLLGQKDNRKSDKTDTLFDHLELSDITHLISMHFGVMSHVTFLPNFPYTIFYVKLFLTDFCIDSLIRRFCFNESVCIFFIIVIQIIIDMIFIDFI